MAHPVHHYHKRKRIYRNYEPYPSRKRSKRFMDKIVYLVAILGPIMTIPQFLKVYVEQNVSGLSLISWSSYFLINIVWLCYGILHKEKPIVLAYSAWMIMNGLIALGIVVYG